MAKSVCPFVCTLLRHECFIRRHGPRELKSASKKKKKKRPKNHARKKKKLVKRPKKPAGVLQGICFAYKTFSAVLSTSNIPFCYGVRENSRAGSSASAGYRIFRSAYQHRARAPTVSETAEPASSRPVWPPVAGTAALVDELHAGLLEMKGQSPGPHQ